MSAATPVHIPGFGQAVAGLDWLLLADMEGRTTEIKQLGRGVNAAWQFVWSMKGQEDEYVAFVSKGEVKKRPVAAAALVRSAIGDDCYLTLVDIGEGRLWVFAVKDGVPANRVDRVGDPADLMGLVSDFLTTLPEPSKAAIYTDKPELLERLPYSLDVRPFSLEILGHSIKKRDFSKAAFSRHSSVPVGGIVVGVVLAGLVGGYYVYQMQAEAAAQRDAVQIRQRKIAKRKVELTNEVRTAINAAAPARVVMPAYLETMSDVPRLISGWKLGAVECAGRACTLIYKAQAFATWAGYVKAKPAAWPAPTFDGDIEKVTQTIPVQLPQSVSRTADTLPQREKVRNDLGNLAQVSKALGLTLAPPNDWQRVAGKAGRADEQWVPMKGTFTATGSAVLLKDLAMRLPDIAGVSRVAFKLDEKLTFDLKGEAYANP